MRFNGTHPIVSALVILCHRRVPKSRGLKPLASLAPQHTSKGETR